MTPIIIVDRKTCTGIGLCEMLAPNVFRVDDDGLIEVIGEVAPVDVAHLADAANSCPTRSIRVSSPGHPV